MNLIAIAASLSRLAYSMTRHRASRDGQVECKFDQEVIWRPD